MPHIRRDFDGDLQMFRESPHDVNLAHLRFLRWLAERGRLEGVVEGRPSGEFADGASLDALSVGSPIAWHW